MPKNGTEYSLDQATGGDVVRNASRRIDRDPTMDGALGRLMERLPHRTALHGCFEPRGELRPMDARQKEEPEPRTR